MFPRMLRVLSQIYPMSNGFSVLEIPGHIFKLFDSDKQINGPKVFLPIPLPPHC